MDLDRLKIDRRAERRRPRRRWLGPALRWVALLAVVAFLVVFFRDPLERLTDRVRLPAVGVVRVVKTSPAAASAVSGTAANGYVVAARRAALSADAPGRIVEMNVTEGVAVRRGDVVARLYAEEYEAALERAEADVSAARALVGRSEAELAVAEGAVAKAVASVAVAESDVGEAHASKRLAQASLGRLEELVGDGIETPQALDEAVAADERAAAQILALEARVAEAQRLLASAELEREVARAALAEARTRVEVAEADRELARATLDKTEVRAPFDGVVVLKDAEVGEVVSPNAIGSQSRGSVVTMVDFASLEVQVDMPERNIAAVELGAPASIYLDAFPDVPYAGRVQRIWPTANRQKATIEVRVAFEAPDERLRPEMGARVVFNPETDASARAEGAPEPDQILIPTECVVRVEGRAGVFEVERDVARFRPVELGDERSGRVRIVTGLTGGERIIAAPPPTLGDGDRVRVQG